MNQRPGSFIKVFGALILTAALGLTGCGHKSRSVDTSALEKSFRSAEPTMKATADQVVTALKSADYENALGRLNQLIQDEKLSAEQRQTSQDLRARIWKMFANNPPKLPENPQAGPPAGKL